MTQQLIQSLWDEHVGWSGTADWLKARRTRWGVVVFVLTICGAALETLAANLPELWDGFPLRRAIAGAGAVALALVPFLTRSFLDPSVTSKWLRARSASEGMKSEIYTFLAGAEPYTNPGTIGLLQQKVRSIRGWTQDLERERAQIGSPTSPAPTVLDAKAYIDSRVSQQIVKYYRPKAQRNAELADRFQIAGIALGGVVAVLGAIATLQGEPNGSALGPWVAVLTTVGGSITAYAASSRFNFQATTFFATARQLQDLIGEWSASGKAAPSKEWSDFVRACEETISAENRAWMAKLDQHP